MKYTREEVKKELKTWNDGLTNFREVELPRLLELRGVHVKDGKIPMRDWFKAIAIYDEQNFYTKGHEIQYKFREDGYDVKMDMQSYELRLY